MNIAFGPIADGFPSWQWVGQDLVDELRRSSSHEIVTFADDIPSCDVLVFVKFKPAIHVLQKLRHNSRLVYCPIDIYESAFSIDADWQSLRCFDCIISHSRHLMKYFWSYTRTDYLDHHLKFTAPLPSQRKLSGPILWTGNAANLPPVLEWAKRNPLPEELWVLTNVESEAFHGGQIPASTRMRVEPWTPDRHREWAALAKAAIDIKGDDFRSRHKPPTKAFDFVASGLPLALNRNSPPVVDLANYGLHVPDPRDVETWFSEDYWTRTQAVAHKLLSQLTLPQIAGYFMNIVRSLGSGD